MKSSSKQQKKTELIRKKKDFGDSFVMRECGIKNFQRSKRKWFRGVGCIIQIGHVAVDE